MSDAVELSGAYERIMSAIAAERCVFLDGAIGTELPQARARGDDEPLWGTRALIEAPELVAAVHRRYVEAGCAVLTTNTWGLAAALDADGPLFDPAGAPVHWMDVARRGLQLAHEAAAQRRGAARPAVAFSLNREIDSERGHETIRLLARLFADEPDPPDLILAETLSIVSDSLDRTVAELVATGVPVWLSFRRCRHGLCSVYGQHWGGPEGDAFGRAARRFEEAGVAALLVNCIPPDHVPGIVSYLRDFTDLPLGAYPNLGYLTSEGWRSQPGVGGQQYAKAALGWRAEGAQIVGGCCGTTPEHIAAARERLEGTRPGRERPAPLPANGALGGSGAPGGADRPASVRQPSPRDAATPPGGDRPASPESPWADERRRRLYPLPFPELVVDPGVEAPDEASFMAWSYLHREGAGAHRRCLDVGSGTGILAIQLALNGAAHVHAIDVDQRAVASTLANAFRNGVEDRLSADIVDLYPWVPAERYEVIVASLAQRPADPFEALSAHRMVDYWGRHLLDQLIGKLASALAPEGVAYVVQLSIVSERRTAELIDQAGFESRVVDYSLIGYAPEHQRAREQIERVEERSDAYHLRVGERDVLVAYLLEVTVKGAGDRRLAELPHADEQRSR